MHTVPALTPRQAAFVDHVMTGRSATVAAQRAGFSPRSARQIAVRLMSKASIRAEIAARQRVDGQRLQIERQDVIQGLLEAIQMGRERQEPMAMIAGLRELAKLLGFYQPTTVAVEVSAGRGMGRIEAMSDAELVAVIAG